MRVDQLIGHHRMQLMAIVESAPSIREGCRRAGIHHSTYYDWMNRAQAEGPAGLVARASRTRSKSAARLRLEAEVVAFAVANPQWGPRRLYGELVMRQVEVGSPSQVWRILKEHDLNTRRHRYRLVAATRGLAQVDIEGRPPVRPFVGSLDADVPGDLVQLDCFHLGRAKEARLGTAKRPGTVWQYTAIDVASSFVWAQLHTTAHNPSAVHTTALAYKVASNLAERGWRWRAASTDRGNEFRATRFTEALAELGVEHRFIAAGRPQSNGKVEQVHSTILEECWKPAWISYVEPSVGGLRHDLDHYVDYYNYRRPHWGKWNKGRTPVEIIEPNAGNQP